MSQITGQEPAHWHTQTDHGNVRHNMTDPRIIPDYSPTHWTPDERAFVKHLEAHENAANSVQPLENDHELVRAALAYLASEERRIASLRELVLALRHELASGVPVAESTAARALKQVWPAATVPTAAERSSG